MWKPLCFVGAVLIGAQAFGQATPPTIPRSQPPTQPGQPENAAQAPGQPIAQPGARQTANYRGPIEADRSQIDSHVAACLTLGNEEEVALGKFAEEHAQNAKVKQFARQMADEHTQAISQLRQFVPQGISLQLSQRDEGAAERPNQVAENRANEPTNERPAQQIDQRGAQPGIPSAQPQNQQPMAGGQHQLLNIEREARQQCLALTEDDLQKLRGDEFDKAYLGQQLGGHIQMVAILQVAERHVSPELQRIVEQQRQTAEKHLDQLRQLKQELARSETASSADRTPR
jgi:predicted outer membrane protein